MEIRNVDGIFNQRVTRVLASVGGDPSLVDGRKKRAIGSFFFLFIGKNTGAGRGANSF